MAKIHGKNPMQKLPKNPAKNPWQKSAMINKRLTKQS